MTVFLTAGVSMAKHDFGFITESPIKIARYDAEGRFHSDGVLLPAITFHDRTEVHMTHGVIGIEGLRTPAVQYVNGDYIYYKNGLIHRDVSQGGSAMRVNGVHTFYVNDVIHREGAPAIVNTRTGEESWYLHGLKYVSVHHYTEVYTAKYLPVENSNWSEPRIRYDYVRRGVTGSNRFPESVIHFVDERDMPHRSNGPAIRYNGAVYYYQHGKLHNGHGPAIIRDDGSAEWYFDGIKIEPTLEELARFDRLKGLRSEGKKLEIELKSGNLEVILNDIKAVSIKENGVVVFQRGVS